MIGARDREGLINAHGITGTYHANMLMQYVKRQRMTSHRFISIETVAVVDEADEYSLENCTFLSTQRTETYKDVSISNELTPEQIPEAESHVEQYPDVLTSLPGRIDIMLHNTVDSRHLELAYLE